MSKQYGLSLPNKHKHGHVVQGLVSKHSAFNSDSDSDREPSKPKNFNAPIKRQDKLLQKQAVEEDPTVYQYDEIYDELAQKKKESKLAKTDTNKNAKYIGSLLQAAERRKRENERRIERQVQKEREAEGDEFKDKEAFVTTAYRKKLEEMKLLEEQEKREEYLESIGDVTKQGNLDGFYRHHYEQQMNFEEEKDSSKTEGKEKGAERNDHDDENRDIKNDDIKDEVIKDEDIKDEDDGIKQDPTGGPSTSLSSTKDFDEGRKVKKGNIKKRKYRKRNSSNSESEKDDEKEEVAKKKEHLPSNLDADSDFSIDSSDSDDEEESKPKKAKIAQESDKEGVKVEDVVVEGSKVESAKIEGAKSGAVVEGIKENETSKGETSTGSSKETDKDGKAIKDEPSVTGKEKTDGETPPAVKVEKEEHQFKAPEIPKKPKIDIWKKRTIGEVFDAALQRYFERKALREAGQV